MKFLKKESEKYGDGTFSGNRTVFGFFVGIGFIFLLPWWMALVFDPSIWDTDLIYFLIPISILYVFLSIGLFHPKKNRWALKVVCGILFVASMSYLGTEIPPTLRGDKPFWGGFGTDTLGNAIGFFVFIGLPCLKYVFSRSRIQFK